MALTRIDSYLVDLDSLGGITFDDQAGTPTFKVDAVNHRVGIGTASPAQKLDVADGDIALRKTTGGDNSGVISQVLRIGTQSGDLACFYAISAGAGGPGGRGGDLHIQTKQNNGAPTDRLVITETGNVGIGTTSPGSVLDVRFPSSPATDNGAGLNAIRSFTTSALAINTGGAISLGGVYASGGEVAAFGQIAGRKENATSGDLWGYLQFSTNSGGGTMVERMRISGPGNVGIGSTAPGTKLDVSGNIRGERYVGINSLVLNTYTTINPSSNVFLYSQPNDRDSWIYLDSADTGSNWGIYHRQIDSAVADLPGNSIGFVGGGATAVQSYISLQTGNAYFRGNVGIGSTVPGENITVYRSVDAGSQVRNHNASAGSSAFAAYRLSSDAAGSAWWWLNSSARTVDGGANTSTIRNDAGDMRLQAAGEVGLHIKASTGNIGIGVPNPSAKLTVDGSINQTWSDVRLGIFYDNSFRQGLAYSTPERTLKIFSTTSDSGGNIAFYTRNGLGASDTDYGTQRMVISAAGNVGIGTTNPGVPLDVRGTDSLIRASETGSGTAWRARIISHNPDGAVQRASFLGVYGTSAGVFAHNAALNGWAPLFVNTTSGSSDGDTVILAGSGSVGIGTASPLAKLHVNATGRAATIGGTPGGNPSGTVATQTSYLELVAGSGGNTSSSAVVFHNPGVSTAALEYLNADANTGYFNFKSDDASWNVGIGTTAPGHKLDVAGNIRLGAQVLGGVATPPHLNLGQNYSSTTLRANCKIRLYDNDANDVYGFGIGSNGDIQYHSTITHQFYNSDVATLLVNGTAPYYKGNIIWHSGNDGAGSGLDADLLDGISSASFVRSDSRSTIGINGRTAAYTGSNLELHTGDNTPPGISFHRGGVSAVNLYESNGYLYQDRWVGGGGLIWTSGNDGTGSGLDADLWDGYQLSVRTNWLDNSAQNIVVGQLAWKNYGNSHTIFDASQGTSPDGTSVNNTNPQAGWQGTFPTLMGWNGANTYGVRVDSARVSDTLISNATVARDLYISGGIGGNYGNRLVVGGTDAVFTAQDSNLRPTIQATGQYPVISLNHTLTGNTNHGPTLQFTCNGVGHQFVIGTTGNGSRMDIGFSSTAGWNPHNGISNYQGTTSMSFATSGNVGIGTTNPLAKLDVRGSSFQLNGVRGTQQGSGYWEVYPLIHYNSDNGNPFITLLTVTGWAAGNSRVFVTVETWSVNATGDAGTYARGSALASYYSGRYINNPVTYGETNIGGLGGGTLAWSGSDAVGATGFSLTYRGPATNYTRTYIKVTAVSHDGADITLASATG